LTESIGQCRQNAQVARGTQRAMADTIYYYGKEDRFVLSGKAKFADGTQRAQGKRIEYLEKQNLTTLTGDATFVDGEQRVSGERITYNGETQVFNSSGRIFITEPPFLLNADSLWYDELTGIAQVQGNVLWRDTLSDRTITADRLDYKAEGDYVKAYGGRPVFSTLVEGDSLWMSADTLLTFLQAPAAQVSVEPADTMVEQTTSSRTDSMFMVASSVDTATREDLRPLPVVDTMSATVASDTSAAPVLVDMDSIRVLLAYPDVRIFKSNLQAICDSLAYSGADSTFRLYEGPIMWSDTSQFIADTVSIQLRNKAIDRVKLQSKSMIVNSPDELFFNQIKGRQVDVDFKAGEVDRMYVRGNAESVYYILDEDLSLIHISEPTRPY